MSDPLTTDSFVKDGEAFAVGIEKATERTIKGSTVAFMKRDELVEEAAALESITTEKGLELAVDICTRLKETLDKTEKRRKEVKDPFNKVGKAIDKIAKDFGNPLLAQLARLEIGIKEFTAKQIASQEATTAEARGKIRQLEKRRQELTDNFNMEKDLLNKKIEEATTKLQSEDPSIRMTAESDIAMAKADLEVAQQTFDLEIVTLEGEVSAVAGAAVAMGGPVDATQQRDYNEDILPEDLLKLALHDISLVKLEIRRSEVLKIIRELKDEKNPLGGYKVNSLPGIKIIDDLKIKY